MSLTAKKVVFLIALIAVFVTVDLLFLRDDAGLRFVVNLIMLLAAALIYARFIRRN